MTRYCSLSAAVLFCSALIASGQQSPSSITHIKLVTADAGWASSQRHLYWTTDDGASWKDVTPPASSDSVRSIASVFFLNSTDGWALMSHGEGEQDEIAYELAATHDGGSTWAINRVVIPGDAELPTGSGEVIFVDAQSGWLNIPLVSTSNFRRGLLLKTSNGGATWSRPSSDPEISGHVTFTDNSHGWIAGGGGSHELYETTNGGTSWNRINKQAINPAADNATYDVPVFTDRQNGFLPVTFTGDESVPSEVTVYVTDNAGKSWKLFRTIPGPAGLSSGQKTKLAFSGQSIVTANTSTDGTFLIRLDSRGQNTGHSPLASSASAALDLTFNSSEQGWVLTAGNGCEINRGQCGQIRHIMATRDGGATWTDVTPTPSTQLTSHSEPTPPISPNAEIAPKNGLAAASAAKVSYGVHVSEHMAFDVCDFPTTTTLATWWEHSYLYDIGFYLGGDDRHCKVAPPAGWVNAVSQQGWGLIPIWVGPQAPCASAKLGKRFSSDLTNATTAGAQEAGKAILKAKAQGLDKTIIYYDLEQYNTNSTCSAAVISFLDAWTGALQNSGFKAAIYVSASNAADFTQVSPVPDDVWVAKYTSLSSLLVTIWHLSPLCDIYSPPGCTGKALWGNQQRIHQFLSDGSATFGGTPPIDIDLNIVDATVTGGQGLKTINYDYTTYDYPGNNVYTFAMNMNNLSTLLGKSITYGALPGDITTVAFTLSDGTLQTIAPYPGQPANNTQYNYINDFGKIVGYYYYQNSSGQTVVTGLLNASGTPAALQPKGATYSVLSGINDANQIVGTYSTSTSTYLPLFYNSGKFRPLPFPAPQYGTVGSINGDSDYAGTAGSSGFSMINGKLQTFVQGSNLVGASGINANTDVIGVYRSDSSSNYDGFFYHQGVFITLDYPGAVSTAWSSINDQGILVGWYSDSTGFTHGLIGTPK